MVLRLYNTLGRRVSTFVPTIKGEVRMYTCGPTVWNYAHVGNFRTFLSEDILRRYLKFKGYKVIQVKNITDVEDKIIEGMKRSGMSLKDLTSFYTKAFMDDLDSLNIQRAEYYPRATEHIEDMLLLIETLMRKGYAYRGDDGSIYYDLEKFRRYGRLSGIRKSELRAGARVSHEHYEKNEAADFALWKAWVEDDGDVFWETRLGKGRPGWHIECSAMAMKYLGPSFDIHTGGKDLRFPHHENEIAQSEAATGVRFAKYWLHMEFLKVNGEEMHKSLGNFITLRDLLKEGWEPRTIRLFLMSASYREVLNITDDSLAQARSNLARLDEFVRRLKSVKGKGAGRGKPAENLVATFLRDFTAAMDDDLNTPRAFAALFTLLRSANALIDQNELTDAEASGVLDALRSVDAVLGLMRFDEGEQEQQISADQARLIQEREEARRRRDFAKADEIRERLRTEGILLQDTPSGPTWRRVATSS